MDTKELPSPLELALNECKKLQAQVIKLQRDLKFKTSWMVSDEGRRSLRRLYLEALDSGNAESIANSLSDAILDLKQLELERDQLQVQVEKLDYNREFRNSQAIGAIRELKACEAELKLVKGDLSVANLRLKAWDNLEKERFGE